MAKKRYMQAINEALIEEMERDPKVILYGEDVEISMFGDTTGLLDRFPSLHRARIADLRQHDAFRLRPRPVVQRLQNRR